MIEAAGGLLWKKGPGTSIQIALVHRHRYDDWTLPKGKLQAGESLLQAALREVREETGYQATVLGFAGAIAYQTSSGQKLVRFWNMIPEMKGRRPIDKSEVTETVWLEPEEACLKMNYPLERAIVEAYMGDSLPKDEGKETSQRPGLGTRCRLWWTLKDIAYENLALQLPLFHKEFLGLCHELSAKKEENEREKGTEVSGAWAPRVQALLENAERHKVSNPDLSWRFLKAAERALLFGEDALHPGEAETRAYSLLEEAKEKIPTWRGRAIKHLLADQPKEQPLPVWKVVRAAKLADEHHDNGFRRLKILRKRLRLFGAASLIITASYIALAPRTGILSNMKPASGLSAISVFALAFMGFMGAVVSVLISTKSTSNDRVPLQQAQAAVLLGRLALGPVSALAVATLLATGIINGQPPDYNIMLAAAFVSGFSERFVLDSINAFSRKSE